MLLFEFALLVIVGIVLGGRLALHCFMPPDFSGLAGPRSKGTQLERKTERGGTHFYTTCAMPVSLCYLGAHDANQYHEGGA